MRQHVPSADTMRAAITSTYGAGGTRLTPVQAPSAARLPPGHLLVRVAYAALEPADALHASGALRHTQPLPLPAVLGADFAGVVVAGSGFAAGARVYGHAQRGALGACAELIVVEAKRCAPVPEGVDLRDAVAVAGAGCYAVSACRAGRLKEGNTALVLGASSSEGCLAAQVAAEVVGEKGRVVAVCADARDAKWLGGVLRGPGEARVQCDLKAVLEEVRPDVVIDCSGRQRAWDTVSGLCSRETRYVGYAMTDLALASDERKIVGTTESEYARYAVTSTRTLGRRLAGRLMWPSFHELPLSVMMSGRDDALSFPNDVAPLLKNACPRVRTHMFKLNRIAGAYAMLAASHRPSGKIVVAM
jgi:NADPH:quinone reductase-like Zn-dependent oxidoreductase